MIEKAEKTKIIIIIMLLIIVIGMAIGYAALSQTLNITGTVNVASNWDIKITNAVRLSGKDATDNLNSPSYTATTASFDVNLASPGATATYEITIKNDGEIPAKLNNIDGIATANQIQPIELKFTTNANINDVLAPGESIDYTVTVTWDSTSQAIPTIKSKTATITFEYVQNT